LKEIIGEESIGTKINFKISDTKEYSITDKFNLYYIRSVDNIVR